MSERLLFLTGHLAFPRLARMVAGFGETARDWRIYDIGVKVAALMTQEIILRRLPRPVEAERVILPGRCRANLAMLAREFGVPFERGPEEIADLPVYLGRGGAAPDLSRHDMRIFAEIVDASTMTVADVVARAEKLVKAGADVIDLGCLPDTPFAHMEKTIAALRAAGLKVSVDSADVAELERAFRAGADHLLSLDENSLDMLPEGAALVPILVAAPHGDLASLRRAAAKARAKKIDFILDPILDPIHFGFAASLARYVELRRLEPDAEIMMGTGNLTELTDADSSGVTAMLLGLCSELNIRNLLTVQVSPHTRRTVEEHDAARRVMFAARADHALPKGYSDALLQIHDKRPYAVDARRNRRTGARTARRQFPHRGRRGRRSHFRAKLPPGRRRRDVAVFGARRRNRRRPRLLPWRRVDEGGDRLSARQALSSGRAAGFWRRLRQNERG